MVSATKARSKEPTILSYFSSQSTPKEVKKPTTKRPKKLSKNIFTDVIVISDSEDESPSASKRKQNDQSSDIEILDEPPPSFAKKQRVEDQAPTTPHLVFGRASSILRSIPQKMTQSAVIKNEVSIENIDESWQEGDDEPMFVENIEVDKEDLFAQSFQESIEATPEPSTSCSTSTSCSSSNAFSVLMSSYKETVAWKEADIAEDRKNKPTKENRGRRRAPFYKVMQGMPIAVDAFCYGAIPGVTAYFLTHAHSDHYTNLSCNWNNGPIYCSEGTANLIIHMLKVDKKWVKPLPMNVVCSIPDTGGVSVTLMDANHCPGSSLFLFEGVQTVNAGDSTYKSPFVGSGRVFRYLHCGDFRASPAHVLHPAVKHKRVDLVYLDTTYLDPKYSFPPQSQVVCACAELSKRIVAGSSHVSDKASISSWATVAPSSTTFAKPKRVLIVVGTYSVGKERVVKAIAKALGSKIYCDARKAALLRCQNDSDLDSLLTKDPLSASVHILPLGHVSSDRLKDYLEHFNGHFTRVIGFRPTGWSFSASPGAESVPSIQAVIAKCQGRTFTHAHLYPSRNSTSNVELYGVPYSEHSSFFELTCFALSFDWVRMIATVNVGSEKSRAKMTKWFERWEVEKRKRREAAQGKLDIIKPRANDYW